MNGKPTPARSHVRETALRERLAEAAEPDAPAGSGKRLDIPPEAAELPRWRRLLPYLGAAFALLLFGAALFILHQRLSLYRPSDIRRALGGLAGWQVFAALGLAAANYLVLTLYDVQALRHVGRGLPYSRVALASFTSYAFSHTLGFGSLIGASVRYRLYTPLGLAAGEVAEVAAFVTVTFMTGLATVFPLAVLLGPTALEAIGVPSSVALALGGAGLIVMVLYIGLGWWIGRPIRILGYHLDLPRPATATAQAALSVVDVLLVAGVLYVSLPQVAMLGYLQVLTVFVLAFVAGIISHVPGGLGVFDTIVLVGLSPSLPATEIVAGLMIYRLVYQLVPLAIAGTLFGAIEALAARRWIASRPQNFGAWAGSVEPMVAAACAFLGGVVMLFSNATPVSGARLKLVAAVLPLPVMEAAHFLGSVAGMVLLMVAHGLTQRLRPAWTLAVVLLGAGAVAALLGGFAWEEAVVLILFVVVLLPARREFYYAHAPTAERYTPGWFLAVAVVVLSSFWLGIFSYKQLGHADQLWWRFTFYSNSSRFLRASVGIAVIALVVGAYRLLVPLRRHFHRLHEQKPPDASR